MESQYVYGGSISGGGRCSGKEKIIMQAKNPILRGFHPDPSIIRVGVDYYIATSTFEWWPGIQINHSRDLVHWEICTYALQDAGLVNLQGIGPSQGIWAPCLTYDKGIFYLAYTVVNSFYCNMYDTRNYLITAENIMGPWSEPVPLHNMGFDPSLFHDTDGKKYMVSMVTDHRVPKKYAGRIVLQEYDPVRKTLVGEIREIYAASDIFLEGPHILKHDGWYYLVAADTGTGEGHGQSILRSRSIWGPYEMYKSPKCVRTREGEAWSIMTTRHSPEYPLQKAGHADFVETPDGQWYAVYLCSRALENRNPADAKKFPGVRRYPLGRETAIQKVHWTEDGWLEIDSESVLPDLVTEIAGAEAVRTKFQPRITDTAENNSAVQATPEQEAADTAENKPVEQASEPGAVDAAEKIPAAGKCPERETGITAEIYCEREDFDGADISPEFQSLRIPMTEEYVSLTARPGWLRMYGREGLASLFRQSLIARRRTEFVCSCSCKVEFEPQNFKQMAGLICMYDTENYMYLHISRDEDCGKCITLLRAEIKVYTYPVEPVPLPEDVPVFLKAEIHYDRIQFYYAAGIEDYQKIGPEDDCSYMSDEACSQGWFTGSMLGICCQDLTGAGQYADFDFFIYSTEEKNV